MCIKWVNVTDSVVSSMLVLDPYVSKQQQIDLNQDSLACMNFHTANVNSTLKQLRHKRRSSVVVSTSAWHAAGRWFDSRTRHVSLLGVKTWLSTGIVYL